MSKDTVSAWDTTPANNTDVGGVDLAENSMRPRDVNNAIRTMMSQIATGIDNSEFGGGGYAPGGTDVALGDGGTGASLVDPNADRIMFWDDSAGAVTWLAPSTGLTISTTNISLSFLGLEALTDPNADRVAFWDDSAGAFAWLTMGTNLTITGTTLDAAGGSGQPVPTSSTFAVGTLLFVRNNAGGSISDGNTIAGSSLQVAYGNSGGALVTGGGAQTGTWTNRSGRAITSSEFGMFARTA